MAHPSSRPRGNKEARKPKQVHPVNPPGLPAGLVPTGTGHGPLGPHSPPRPRKPA
jgi:hypothetical protein